MELQVGVKILLKNKDGKYLLVFRSAEKYPQVLLKWDIVGGRINPGTALLENLKREVAEETGLSIKGEPSLLTAQDILRSDKHIVRLTYVGFADGEVRLSEEHSEYKWFTKEEIKNEPGLDQYFKEVFNKFEIE